MNLYIVIIRIASYINNHAHFIAIYGVFVNSLFVLLAVTLVMYTSL